MWLYSLELYVNVRVFLEWTIVRECDEHQAVENILP